MIYSTLDIYPDLSAAAMTAARPLSFAPVVTPSIYWDQSADFYNTITNERQNDLFSFTGVANAGYAFFSHSTREPSMIKVYDRAGNVVAIDREGSSDVAGDDHLLDFIAPYSGTYYVAAGWTEVKPDPYLRLHVYAKLNSGIPLVNEIKGTAGNDILWSSIRNDVVDGGAGYDKIYFTALRADFNIVSSGGALTVSSKYGTQGTDTLRNMELLDFQDEKIDIRYSELAQALYVGYFGRAADVGGLKSFQNQLAALNAPSSVNELNALYARDTGIRSLVDSFGGSAESQALYTGDNKAFVKAIYNNLLGRAPDLAGLDFWSGAIDSGSLTRANASLSIMAGATSNTSTQGQADARLLEAKISVASNFTFALEADGLGDAYAGAGAAGVARKLLGSVGAATDAAAFQPSVRQAILALTPLPRAAAEPESAPHWLQADTPPVTLTGIDLHHDSSALFA